MGDRTICGGQWGKRECPEAGFDECGSRHTNAGASPLRPSDGNREPALHALPLNVHAELFHWLDAHSRACVAQSSSLLACRLRLVRRMEAGPLLEGGRIRPQALEARRASDQWLYEKSAKFIRSCGWQNFSVDFEQFDPDERQALEAIGFEAGYRFLHIDGLRCHQPVLNGVVKASGWQSLSACYQRDQLQQGLNDLATAIVPRDTEMRRELSLRIFDCHEKLPFIYPGKLRSQGLDLVELYLDQVIDPAQFLRCFCNEQGIESLEILVEQSVADAAVVIDTVGRNFPELRYFRLVSYQAFGIAADAWSEFLSHHPNLDTLDLNHAHFSLRGAALDFSLLPVTELVLTDFHLSDPGEGLAAWIKNKRPLNVLEIELASSALEGAEPAEMQVRDKLLEAIAANVSLSDLRLRGEAWLSNGDDVQACDSFLSLLDALIGFSTLTSLQIPAFGIRDMDDLLNGAVQLRESREWMEKLETLERLRPGLELTLGEFELRPVRYRTSIPGSDPKAMQALRGWPAINRVPSPGESLEFEIDMPVWGDGAFRRFIKFCALQPDRQQRYLIGLAKGGNLVEGSLKIVKAGGRKG